MATKGSSKSSQNSAKGTSSSPELEDELDQLLGNLSLLESNPPVLSRPSIYSTGPGVILRELEWRMYETNGSEIAEVSVSNVNKTLSKAALEQRKVKQSENVKKIANDVVSRCLKLTVSGKWPEDSVVLIQKIVMNTFTYPSEALRSRSTDERVILQSPSEVFKWFGTRNVASTSSDASSTQGTCSRVVSSMSGLPNAPKTMIRFWAVCGHVWANTEQRDGILAYKPTSENVYTTFIKEIHCSWKRGNLEMRDGGTSKTTGGTVRCSFKQCKPCEQIYVTSSFLGFPIRQHFTCSSECLIYGAICMKPNCKKIYIGKTKRRLSARIKEHIRPSSKPVGEHEKTNGHKMMFTGLVYASEIDAERSDLETAFLHYVKHKEDHFSCGKRELLNERSIDIDDCDGGGCRLCASWEQ